MTARQRLCDAMDEAAGLCATGEFDAARRLLLGLVADPEAAVMGEPTSLGLPRRLQSALLKVAKAEGDPLRRIGYQFHLVPDPQRLARFARFSTAERRAVTAANTQAVPRVIHQIWIGPLAPPVSTAAWAAHAAAQGFGYRLWREPDLGGLGIAGNAAYRRMLAEHDFPGAVDVARYALLDREGGVYLDCDWYPARQDIGLHHLMPLTGLCAMAEDVPRNTGKGPVLLANSLIAAPSAHPVLRRLNAVLPDVLCEMPRAPAWWATGPLLFTLLARGGSVTLADAALVAGRLDPDATPEEVTVRCAAALAADEGLLLAWKPW